MNDITEELRNVAAQWDAAMISNDADAIGAFMTDDWVIVGPDGRVTGKQQFLAVITSGDLSHNVMETHDMDVRVYGDTAVTVASGVSGGSFRGEDFLLKERVSCVFVRGGDTWRCVHTHLSAMADASEC